LEIKKLKAIILAAGEGKRLSPLTDENPKTMVELFGKPILQRQIETFHECGINDIIIVKGYMQEKINYPNITYFKNSKYASTNMVETLFCARSKLKDSVIISYGDIIFETKILKKLIESNEDISVIVDKKWKSYWDLRFENPLDDAETLMMDSNQYITEIGQKTKNIENIEGQYIGLMKFQNNGLQTLIDFYDKVKEESSKGINLLNPNIEFKKSYMTDLLQGIVKSGIKIKSILINNGWLELDTLDDYKKYNEMYDKNQLEGFFNLEIK